MMTFSNTAENYYNNLKKKYKKFSCEANHEWNRYKERNGAKK